MKKDRLRPALFAYTYLIAAIMLHFRFPIKTLIPFPYTLFGILLLSLGLVINVQASALIDKRKTTFLPFDKPSALILDGPFRYSRNPIYLSAVIISLGLAVLVGSLVAFFAPVLLFVTFDVVFVRHEEKILEAAFGQDYVTYKQRVRRWL